MWTNLYLINFIDDKHDHLMECSLLFRPLPFLSFLFVATCSISEFRRIAQVRIILHDAEWFVLKVIRPKIIRTESTIRKELAWNKNHYGIIRPLQALNSEHLHNYRFTPNLITIRPVVNLLN